ncbi:LytR/AlgR family response regulator transcription factor [Rubrolithibacter danxiaensis]|uniref:LytR/AlgR family response regulator transcription factor n=1 Tax=Rubrolithibacter danxiaensis TaxID=3390805 RepID=UPI003BF82BD8
MFTNKKISIVIADDEPAARTSIETLLSGKEDIDVLASCCDGNETAAAIIQLKPDLVFLDIQMPELNGFEVLETVSKEYCPAFIFVTAFDQYALKAFEKSAVDYLLKPYDDERFYASLDKARVQIRSSTNQLKIQQAEALLALLQPSVKAAYKKRLLAKNNGKISFVPVDTISFIESEGNFVRLYTGSESRTANYTFKQLSDLLDPEKFARIHKSHIVNIDHIEIIEPYLHGDSYILLKDGTKLKLSRNYKSSLEKILE